MTAAVVCGIDGSAGATTAARVAQLLADRFGLPLSFIHVVHQARRRRGAAGAGLLRGAVDDIAPDGDAPRSTFDAGHLADRLVALSSNRGVVRCRRLPRPPLIRHGTISADVRGGRPLQLSSFTRSLERGSVKRA